MEVFMSFIKQFLLITAFLGALIAPKQAYSQQVTIPGGNAVLYVGVTAVLAYIFYSWQQDALCVAKPAMVKTETQSKKLSEAELSQAVLDVFKPHENLFKDYLQEGPVTQGCHLYLAEDQEKMVDLFENIRVFLADSIRDLIFLDCLLVELENLESELKAELAISTDYVDPDFAAEHGARAARAEYYAQACDTFIKQAAATSARWQK